jgi:hypothetical protein
MKERFRGVLVPFVKNMLRDTQKGFQAMGEAIRQRAEAATGGGRALVN